MNVKYNDIDESIHGISKEEIVEKCKHIEDITDEYHQYCLTEQARAESEFYKWVFNFESAPFYINEEIYRDVVNEYFEFGGSASVTSALMIEDAEEIPINDDYKIMLSPYTLEDGNYAILFFYICNKDDIIFSGRYEEIHKFVQNYIPLAPYFDKIDGIMIKFILQCNKFIYEILDRYEGMCNGILDEDAWYKQYLESRNPSIEISVSGISFSAASSEKEIPDTDITDFLPECGDAIGMRDGCLFVFAREMINNTERNLHTDKWLEIKVDD